eukprot:Awhi_evm1s1711
MISKTRTFDLSSLKLVDTAAEPIDPLVLNDMESVLGLDPSITYGSYGLAECVVYCCGGGAGYDRITAAPRSGKLSTLQSKNKGDYEKSDVEQSSMKVIIVNETHNDLVGVDGNEEVAEGVVGLVFTQGPCVVPGYDHMVDLTRKTFHNTVVGHDGFCLNTGDLGYVRDGYL